MTFGGQATRAGVMYLWPGSFFDIVYPKNAGLQKMLKLFPLKGLICTPGRMIRSVTPTVKELIGASAHGTENLFPLWLATNLQWHQTL